MKMLNNVLWNILLKYAENMLNDVIIFLSIANNK